ncbi:UDP-N-acetyl-D-glucosamine 2-epimerase, UDP-hydrolysing [Vibrio sp. 10N.286.55.E10]|uniref:UDP-N-acetylglucosamine 2-epimerase n=1 Tax=unclassified Vibrio TaxID=2614977 RepID=UPI000C81D60B|nr:MULTISPECIES: UDP-N-acetylglucosamine 2-epimerase [unclassified Vibrio]PME35462.1 UDP-N-acetyl-D-glucosamine 2-epimerase, UDP-hydrolysing [Vibrio sp. 10N.286.55.E10]PME36668.1 UDP-N-acetyl-D-glucosamine 2-epimerase, UDP-hydrolysing [Vibrio sp. 10N.286.55.E12]PME66987.1 UDP-N-acetyl-D-glucosamine 2-epimerase, UDP-hydrolysing [Vibrio sp. 10N.286.55.C11]PMI22925.1 UDP-N-acetyl-D-glucosamine 2-epimerase, UDP-hydrolysing [Vibrio sp. 10N.286.46.E10]PMI90822.1 UDP-N-acetyl-D-glucosamine 2-epimeras
MRKICVVTATRAEYGLLKCLLEDIQNDSVLELQLISTGSHLSPEFGLTNQQILDDGFVVNKTVEILLSSDTPVGVSKSMGLAQISFSEAFDELKPDIVVVLGDRYELVPIVSAANIARIPVAHLSGGELTEGAIDELIRHAITKLSQLHFTAMDEYSTRVIQMGELPERVFTVGEVGLDNLLRMQLMSKDEFENSISCKLKERNLLFTYHPETTQDIAEVERDFREILSALDTLEHTLVIFTKANADVGGRLINKMIDKYVAENTEKAIAFTSLGQLRYLSALQYMDAVVGNSSSGIVEAPSFKLATINIGNRQKGRVKANSTIDVSVNKADLTSALAEVYTPEFMASLKHIVNPYGRGNSSEKVVQTLKTVELSSLKTKQFYDVKY